MRLYQIPLEAADIAAELAEHYGELTPEIEQRIAAFLADGKEKVEAAAMVVKSLEGDAEVCKAEAKRLLGRAEGLDRAADRLKGLILFAVDEGFGGRVRTELFTIWAQSSAATISFELKPDADIYLLSAQESWCVRMRDPELDRVALKEAVKAGRELPYCVTATENPGTRYLRIR
jgi:Siphovirus Gp157